MQLKAKLTAAGEQFSYITVYDRVIYNRCATCIVLRAEKPSRIEAACCNVLVMYGGVVVEEGTVREIFYEPKHPYTWGLLRSIPQKSGEKRKLIPIPGSPPDLIAPPPGCPFAERCPKRMPQCERQPAFYAAGEGHRAACWLWAYKEIQA